MVDGGVLVGINSVRVFMEFLPIWWYAASQYGYAMRRRCRRFGNSSCFTQELIRLINSLCSDVLMELTRRLFTQLHRWDVVRLFLVYLPTYIWQIAVIQPLRLVQEWHAKRWILTSHSTHRVSYLYIVLFWMEIYIVKIFCRLYTLCPTWMQFDRLWSEEQMDSD